MRESGVIEQPMTQADFEELKAAGLDLFNYMQQQGFRIQGDAQESPAHLGVLDLEDEVRAVSDTITALAKRFKDPGAKSVSWEEYLDAKTQAQTVLEKIKNLHT